MSKKVVMVIVVVAVVVLFGVLLWVFGPSLMQTIIDMHRAR